MSIPPHGFWQTLDGTGPFPEDGFVDRYPAALPDGRRLWLPIRMLPGDGDEAVASLILTQASFEVQDVLADVLAERLRDLRAEVIAGVPTLGLALAAAVAKRLGHPRFVALGTSRKFWYDDALSVPVSSITSPGAGKRLFLDPRMLPLLDGQRVVVIDDVVSTGTTLSAARSLLSLAGCAPVAAGFAMAQGVSWTAEAGDLPVRHAIASPRLRRNADGSWTPE